MVGLIGTICLQVLVYCVGIYVLFNEKIKYIRLSVIILLICSGGHYLLKLSFPNMLYVHASAIIILWILLDGSIKQKSFITLKGVFIIGSSEEIIEALIDIVIPFNNSIISEEVFILANVLLLVIYLVTGAIKYRKIKIERKYTSTLVMIAMGIMAIALVLVMASIQYAEPYVNNKKFSVISNTLTIISYFGIVIFGLFIIYVKNANEKFKYLLEMENLLRNSQKNNYEVMLAKEEETRTFRHDISNHIICLQEMIRDGNIDEANKYMEQLQIAILQIQKKNYTTGNEILDAILNYYVQQLEDDIEVNISGLCSCNFEINEVELCSIVSNPIQNAIEALNNQTDGRRYLKIRMNSTNQNYRLEIINSFSWSHFTIINGVPKTLKEDKENHGIGLRNVKKLVEKNNGIFEIKINENEFLVILILPVNNLHYTD